MPHDDVDSEAYGSHVPLVPPLQQPVGHVLASHEQVPFVLSQTLFAHALQAAPPAPHSAPLCEA